MNINILNRIRFITVIIRVVVLFFFFFFHFYLYVNFILCTFELIWAELPVIDVMYGWIATITQRNATIFCCVHGRPRSAGGEKGPNAAC